MAGIYANLASIMSDRNMSLSRTPFNPEIVVIKRASFPKGETPAHLRSYSIPAGQGRGVTGTVVYKGRKIPKVAAELARKYGNR